MILLITQTRTEFLWKTTTSSSSSSSPPPLSPPSTAISLSHHVSSHTVSPRHTIFPCCNPTLCFMSYIAKLVSPLGPFPCSKSLPATGTCEAVDPFRCFEHDDSSSAALSAALFDRCDRNEPREILLRMLAAKDCRDSLLMTKYIEGRLVAMREMPASSIIQ